MAKSYCLGICVRDQLRKSDEMLELHWKGSIRNDEGDSLQEGREIRVFWEDELAQGHEFVPFGICSNFDYKHGCLGHQI